MSKLQVTEKLLVKVKVKVLMLKLKFYKLKLQRDLEKCDGMKTASSGLFIKLKYTLSFSEHYFE